MFWYNGFIESKYLYKMLFTKVQNNWPTLYEYQALWFGIILLKSLTFQTTRFTMFCFDNPAQFFSTLPYLQANILSFIVTGIEIFLGEKTHTIYLFRCSKSQGKFACKEEHFWRCSLLISRRVCPINAFNLK